MSRPSRPRARQSTTENLLRQIEQGSLTHLARLSGFHWPSDPSDGVVALRVVLSLLDEQPLRDIDCFERSFTDVGSMAQSFKRIRQSIAVVETALKELSRRGSDIKEMLDNVLLEYMSVLLRHLSFISRISHWVYADQENASVQGPLVACAILEKLVGVGGQALVSARTSDELYHLLLFLYMWRSPSGATLASFKRPCPISETLQLVSRSREGRSMLRSFIEELPRSGQADLIDSAKIRLQEWTDQSPRGTHPTHLPRYVLKTIDFLHQYMDIPSFARAYVKSGFGGFALRISRDRTDLQAQADDNIHRPITYPAGVSIKLYPDQSGKKSAWVVHHLFPQLLENGLLDILVDYLISLSPDTPYPWFAWVGRAETGHPLPSLSSLAVHGPTHRAMADAIRRIPEGKLRTLSSGWYEGHWKPFYSDFHMYDHIWSHQRMFGRDARSLCDNANHRNTSPSRLSGELPESRQCSHCRTVVYCSKECQKEDWKRFHKDECARQYKYALDRRLDSAWVSHTQRAFFLALLQHFVCNFEVGYSLEKNLGRIEGPGLLVFHHPPGWSPDTEWFEETKDEMVQFNTLYCPPQPSIAPLDEFKDLSHGGVYTYRDPRYLAMFDELEEAGRRTTWRGRHIRIASTAAFCGVYRIYVTGRFEVVQTSEKTSVEILNGYVKVEERVKLETSPGHPVPY